MTNEIATNKYENARSILYGLFILALLTYLCYGIAGGLQNRLSQNPLLIAVLFGMLIGNVFGVPDSMKPAIDFSVKYFIKAGVVLVGLKISTNIIFSIGYGPVAVALGELITILFITYFFLYKILKLDNKLSFLIAAGSAICGAAAILAVAVTIKSKQQLVTLSVTLITLMGTLQLFLYPYLYDSGFFIHFNDKLFGIFAGASIYEIAQVYGAGYAVSDTAGNFATLVKLIKVLMLVPLIIILGRVYKDKNDSSNSSTSKITIPWFIVFFIIVVGLNSAFTINSTVKFVLGQFGAFLFLLPLVALGLKTNIRSIVTQDKFKTLFFGVLVVILITTIFSYYYTLWSTFDYKLKGDGMEKSLTIIDKHYNKAYYSGKNIFKTIGCNKCHVESMPTKSGELLLLYSDLLIHNMGSALNDKIKQGQAGGADWRTTPLAGIGKRTRYIHDGRAKTYREAILVHGGEAKIVRNRFADLNENDKKQIYAFLDTLK